VELVLTQAIARGTPAEVDAGEAALRNLAASAGNQVIGIAVSLVHDTKGVGTCSSYATKGLGSFRRRRYPFDVDAGQKRSRAVAIDDGLRGPEYVVLDG